MSGALPKVQVPLLLVLPSTEAHGSSTRTIPTRPCLLLSRQLLRSPQVRRGERCILFVVDGVHTPFPAVRDHQRRLQIGGPGVVDAGIGTTKDACP